MDSRAANNIIFDLYRIGFASIDAFADRHEVRTLRRLIFTGIRRAIARKSNLCVEVVPPSDVGGGRVMQLQRLSYFVPQLRSHPVFKRLHNLARQILGDGAVYTWDTAVVKSGHAQKGTPWHQDAAFDPRAGLRTYLPYAVSCWLSLTPASPKSGCLSYVARSHLGDLQPHTKESDHSLSMDVDEERFRPVDCFAAPGTLLLHQPKTWHRSSPNTTSLARVAWSVNFDA